MFENSPIIKCHSRRASQRAASGIFVGLCEISAKSNADYVKSQAYITIYQHNIPFICSRTFLLRIFIAQMNDLQQTGNSFSI